MMWIVRLALSRPYTFVVMSLLIAVMGVLSIMTMSVDIFPKINIPVVTSIWSYSGLSPTEMQDRITTIVERALTTTVNNIEHMESQSIRGNSVIKMFFQPGTDVNGSVAQVTALSQTLIKPLPPGITPPLILQYNAADVPVIMLSLGSDQLSETEIADLGQNFIRTQLVAVQGAAVPLPYGGKTRVVNVDIDSDALYTRGLSPQDVVNAMVLQNLTIAPGTAKMGSIEYDVAIDSSPEALDELNNIPIKYVNGTLVTVRDIGFVHDGFQPQTNLVRHDGRHSVLLPVLTSGSASTLSVVSAVRQLMPTVMAGMPKSLNLEYLFDQSVFVRASISGVVREGVIAACLTGLMILVFLGSWRSTLIVSTSIPLAILASISVLYIFGRDAQRDDARRPGARRRHSRGRRDGRDREQPSAPGHGEADQARDPRRGGRGRHARDRRDAVHLHRVRPDLPAARRRRVPVRAPGHVSRVRDARQLSPLAHAGPADVLVLDARRSTGTGSAGERPEASFPVQPHLGSL